MITNNVGIEFEYLLRDESGELVFPNDYAFSHDEYIILGEVRAKEGKTPEETLSNFYKTFLELKSRVNKAGLTLDLNGYAMISNKFNAEIMKKMQFKEISQSKNIYGTDILEDTDSIVENGKVIGKYLSTGLHIHFSSMKESKRTHSTGIPEYKQVLIQGIQLPFDVYKKTGERNTYKDTEVKASVSRITTPVVNYIVEEFDNKILPSHKMPVPLKFRKPGFYETKSYGFEYRSLPFYEELIGEDMEDIVYFAFEKLEELNL